MHVTSDYNQEKIPLRASKEQPLDAPLSGKGIVFEQKLDE